MLPGKENHSLGSPSRGGAHSRTPLGTSPNRQDAAPARASDKGISQARRRLAGAWASMPTSSKAAPGRATPVEEAERMSRQAPSTTAPLKRGGSDSSVVVCTGGDAKRAACMPAAGTEGAAGSLTLRPAGSSCWVDPPKPFRPIELVRSSTGSIAVAWVPPLDYEEPAEHERTTKADGECSSDTDTEDEAGSAAVDGRLMHAEADEVIDIERPSADELPEHWVLQWSKKQRRWYYFHRKTALAQWHRPDATQVLPRPKPAQTRAPEDFVLVRRLAWLAMEGLRQWGETLD